MTIEAVINANTAALLALTQAINNMATPQTSAVTAPKDEAPEAAPVQVVELDHIGYDELAAVFTALVKTRGRAAGVELLAEFKAKTLRDIALEQYAEVAAVAKMALEAE